MRYAVATQLLLILALMSRLKISLKTVACLMWRPVVEFASVMMIV